MQRLEHFQKAVHVFGEAGEACCFQHALAVDHDGAAGTQRHAYPLFAVRAQIGFARGIPAAVFVAQVGAQVGHIDQLVRVEVGVVIGRQNNVSACTGVGGHRGFGAYVFPALGVDPHFDAGFFSELFHIHHVRVELALHKTAPSQHAQLGVFLRHIGPLRLRLGAPQHGRDSGSAGGNTGGLDELATVGIGHGVSRLEGFQADSA